MGGSSYHLKAVTLITCRLYCLSGCVMMSSLLKKHFCSPRKIQGFFSCSGQEELNCYGQFPPPSISQARRKLFQKFCPPENGRGQASLSLKVTHSVQSLYFTLAGYLHSTRAWTSFSTELWRHWVHQLGPTFSKFEPHCIYESFAKERILQYSYASFFCPFVLIRTAWWKNVLFVLIRTNKCQFWTYLWPS